jgi:hypothetical protein
MPPVTTNPSMAGSAAAGDDHVTRTPSLPTVALTAPGAAGGPAIGANTALDAGAETSARDRAEAATIEAARERRMGPDSRSTDRVHGQPDGNDW